MSTLTQAELEQFGRIVPVRFVGRTWVPVQSLATALATRARLVSQPEGTAGDEGEQIEVKAPEPLPETDSIDMNSWHARFLTILAGKGTAYERMNAAMLHLELVLKASKLRGPADEHVRAYREAKARLVVAVEEAHTRLSRQDEDIPDLRTYLAAAKVLYEYVCDIVLHYGGQQLAKKEARDHIADKIRPLDKAEDNVLNEMHFVLEDLRDAAAPVGGQLPDVFKRAEVIKREREHEHQEDAEKGEGQDQGEDQE